MLVFEEMCSFLGVIFAGKKMSFIYYKKFVGGTNVRGTVALVVCALVFRLNGPGRGGCVVFLSETLSPCRCINGYQQT